MGCSFEVWAPNLGPYLPLPCLGGLRYWPLFWDCMYWVYKDSRLRDPPPGPPAVQDSSVILEAAIPQEVCPA